jgi:hypothetical protein
LYAELAKFDQCLPSVPRTLNTLSPKVVVEKQTPSTDTAVGRFSPWDIGRLQVRCSHLHQIETVTPSALGCEECLRMGSRWVHLRLCRSCGHVGCCDDSPNRHARGHFEATGHPIIEGYDPPEGWGWCYIDDIEVDLANKTPHNGPIPRFV